MPIDVIPEFKRPTIRGGLFMPKPIYLDYNATTPHDPEVIDAMRPFLEEEFGNPSSSHYYGSKPTQAVAQAREQVASLLDCQPHEIIFTSGGTESNNQALMGVIQAYRDKGNHIITSHIEHPAILEVCGYLGKKGMEVTYLPVDRQGMVSVSAMQAAVTDSTILITIMHANNEVGTIQPLSEIARIAKANGILLHTDAAQSVGKIPTAVDTLGVDLLSIAGHKVYAPKGVGALFIRDGVKLASIMHGAGQESGRRPGTENVLEIVGLGKACEIAARDMDRNMTQMQHMRDRLYEGIKSRCGNTRINGHPQKRLPNTLSISFEGLEANRILDHISARVAASAGAACHSDTIEISGVLKAMEVPLNWAKGTLRLTTGRGTTEPDIDTAVEVIIQAVESLKD
jgi:cysteine desulfurase